MGALPTFVPLMKVQTARHLDREIRPDEIRIRPRPVFQYESNRTVVVKVPPRPRDVIVIESVPDKRPDVAAKFHNWPLPQALVWKQIVAEVCERHGVPFRDIVSQRRDRKTAKARAEACYRLRMETTLSLPQIGRKLGGRDHTTILHSVRRYEARLEGQEYRKRPLKSVAEQ